MISSIVTQGITCGNNVTPKIPILPKFRPCAVHIKDYSLSWRIDRNMFKKTDREVLRWDYSAFLHFEEIG